MTRRAPVLVFVLPSIAAAASCGPYSPPSPTPAAPSCVDRTAPTHNDMPRNGLSPEALEHGYPVLEALARHPFEAALASLDGLHGPAPSRPAGHADVGELVEYIASCALDRGVKLGSPLDKRAVLHGELGLCGARSPHGNWQKAPPTKACLETVSACVLARVNALHRKVLISVRGEPACLFPLQERVPVEPTYREDDGSRGIESFAACAADARPAAGQRCGFAPRFVGRCVPGATVRLAFEREGFARVCKGIHGCNEGEDHPPYAGHVEGGAVKPGQPIKFVCPANGTFSLQVASPTGGPADAALDAIAQRTSEVRYPANEEEVFAVREGTFYGNIFAKPGQHKPDRALFGDQFACYDRAWRDPVAHFADRLCAVPDARAPCFENRPVECPSSCSDTSAPPQSAFLACQGVRYDGAPPARWTGVTVFLNDPCDLSQSGAACSRAAENPVTRKP